MKRIVQIIPADGWYAVFCESDDKQRQPAHTEKLVCWALVEDSDYVWDRRNIVGMCLGNHGRVETVEDDDLFVGYSEDG